MCETCGGHEPAAPSAVSGAESLAGLGGVRIVVVGKGGVGKSTVSALLSRILARRGHSVVAVDADEQRNLAVTLGVAPLEALEIIPLAEQADYIEEKTGARPGEGAGGMLRLNPDTTDLVARHAVTAPDGVRLVVMGGARQAGGGCLCPETALVSAAVAGMHLHATDVVVMDTHAGVEHFGRALARGFDAAVVIVDPTYNAVQVGLESARLAAGLGIDRQLLAVNRSREAGDLDRVRSQVAEAGISFDAVVVLPHDDAVLGCEPSVQGLLAGSAIAEAADRLADAVVALAVVAPGTTGGAWPAPVRQVVA